MTFHRPGLPGDLPDPALLWARWAFAAVLTANTGDAGGGVHRTGYWLDGEGVLRADDCGSTRWWFSRAAEGRWVLYGEDESSDVKWHKPAVDMLAGAPDWLPCPVLGDLLTGYELGCVYWHQDGAWARAPYPDGVRDDGLRCGMGRFADAARTVQAVGEWLEPDGEDFDADAAALLTGAETYRLSAADLERLATRPDTYDLPAMLDTLNATGLTGGSAPVTRV